MIKKREEKERTKIAQVRYLNEFVDMTSHNLVGRRARETFRSSAVTTSYAFSTASSTSSQTLDEQESTFSFPLSVKHGLLETGVVISSTEVAEEAVLIVSVLGTAGAMGIVGVTGGPFPITRTVLFQRLDNGSFFLDLILAYISWLNLVVILAKKEKKEKKKRKQ